MHIYLYHNELGQYEVIQDNNDGNDVIIGQYPDLAAAEKKFREVIHAHVVAAHKKCIMKYQVGHGHVIKHNDGKPEHIAGKQYLGL